MEKLKKLIRQLPDKDYQKIENDLVNNKSEKFLFLFKAMRENNVEDEALLRHLKCNENALYVLKSRLYDKVQKHLTQTTPAAENISASGAGQPDTSQILFEYPRETAIAILLELEKKYLKQDIPGELISIYSALKKAHYNSEKFYLYSQLYNKQMAYAMALEKAEDNLFTFNKTLSNYYFSQSENDLDLLKVLSGEMNNIHALHRSHRIELIRNCVAIQTQLFTPLNLYEDATEDLLERSGELVKAFPNDKQISYYGRVFNSLRFEYYMSIGQLKKAAHYYTLVDQTGRAGLLLSPLCQAHRFLLSKIIFLAQSGRTAELEKEEAGSLADNYDFYTEVVIRLYYALVRFYTGKVKEASSILNELLNEASFKDFFHMELQVKLTLAYFYIKQTQFELAENLVKSVSRKLNDVKKEGYPNAKAFVKYLTLLMDDTSTEAKKARLKTALEQFIFYNTGQSKILAFLIPELERQKA